MDVQLNVLTGDFFFIYEQDPVDMVGHDPEYIKSNRVEMFWYLKPARLRYVANP
jgi:hypothetical protein